LSGRSCARANSKSRWVVTRDGHDRTGPVCHEDEARRVDRPAFRPWNGFRA
jgi:hypothetical protein